MIKDPEPCKLSHTPHQTFSKPISQTNNTVHLGENCYLLQTRAVVVGGANELLAVAALGHKRLQDQDEQVKHQQSDHRHHQHHHEPDDANIPLFVPELIIYMFLWVTYNTTLGVK